MNPGGSYTKLDNNGNLYSYTQFGKFGNQTMRIDYQGRPHAGVFATYSHIYISSTRWTSGVHIRYVLEID